MEYGPASIRGGASAARIYHSVSASGLARFSDLAGAGTDGDSTGTTAGCSMVAVLTPSTVTRFMTATRTSTETTAGPRPTVAVTAVCAALLGRDGRPQVEAPQVRAPEPSADRTEEARHAAIRRAAGPALVVVAAGTSEVVATLAAGAGTKAAQGSVTHGPLHSWRVPERIQKS